MKNLVWQKFILGCENLDYALKNGLGGVIFFTKDIQTEEQFKTLINEIKSNSITPPFLSIDQEGGRVERTENIRSKRLSVKYAYEKGVDFLRIQSDEISRELSEWGINLNFAPCVDVNTNPQNPIIGERAFSNNPQEVIEGAKIFIESLRKYGIIPCIKHFPGHGDADKDSHLELPQIDLSLSEMERIHLKPFRTIIENGIEMVMVAHLYCKCFDGEVVPSSLSKNVISYLRNNVGYDGVLISDDMVMKGVSKYGMLESVLMGIDADLDMFIFRDSDKKTLDMIDDLCKIVENDNDLQKKILKSNDRISRLKQKISG